MAFCTMLLLSLGALTQIEVQSANIEQLRAQARDNARLALQIALEELQYVAGPDARVTATAQAVGEPTARRHWTGVWRSDNGVLEQWLVSGGGKAAQGEVTFLASLYPASADAARRVTVPRVSLGQGRHYAYWIADEGVKAKVNVIDPYRLLAADSEEPASVQERQQRQGYRQLVSQETGAALLLGAAQAGELIDPQQSAQISALERVYDIEQLDLVAGAAQQDGDGGGGGQGAPVSTARTLFHDVTLESMGVLADVRRGGLKKDLTTAFESSAAAPADFNPVWWNRLGHFYRSALSAPVAITAQVDTDGNGQSYFPVIVKANFYLTLMQSPPAIDAKGRSGREVYVGFNTEFSLHNPYNVRMDLPDGFVAEVIFPAESDPADNLGTFGPTRLRFASRIDRLGNKRDNAALEAALGRSGIPRFFVRFEFGNAVSFEPGQTLLFSVDNTATAGTHRDISASTDGAVVAKLKQQARYPLDYVYKRILINDSASATGPADDYKNLLDSQIAAATDLVLEVNDGNNSPDVFAQMRLGLLSGSGSTPTHWFTGIRTPLNVGNVRLETVSDFAGRPLTFTNNIAPNGGFAFSFEMPMSRRGNETGRAMRQLVDYNMRAVPADLADTAPTAQMPQTTQYARVRTDGSGSMMGGTAGMPMKWWFHPMNMARKNAEWDVTGVLLPGVASGHSAQYGWAGPSPLGREGSGSAKRGITAAERTIYFDVPTFAPLSLGALRHAHVLDDSHAPAYSVGTAYAPAFASGASLTAADELYQLNELLWDGYFFSTFTTQVAAAMSEADWARQKSLPSSRLRYRFATGTSAARKASLLADSQRAAAHLMVDGAFNVNSTSVVAWRALLASTRNALADLRAPQGAPADSPLRGTAFPRFSRTLLNNESEAYRTGEGKLGTPSGYNVIGKDKRQYIYNAIRVLDDEEIDKLAQNIVFEIKRRGSSGRPILGLAEFVNRSLAPMGGEGATQRKGLLQLAIDQGPYDADSAASVLDRWYGATSADADAEPSPAINIDALKNDAIPTLGLDGLVGAAQTNSYGGTLELEPRSADAPAYLTQGDILAALGPVLSVRSDTFVIRAYGDVVGSGTTDAPQARAWCEALVQRLPDPVERMSDDSGSPLYNEPSTATADTLGRRFVVLSFRWLGDGEY